MGSDIWLVLRFWGTLFFIGSIAYPLTKVLFGSAGFASRSSDLHRSEGWFDDGYFFSKAVGMATVAFGVFLLGSLKILPFGMFSIALSMAAVFVLGLVSTLLNAESGILNTEAKKKKNDKNFLFGIHTAAFRIQVIRDWAQKILLISVEEGVFLALFIFWAFIKGHEPSIHGLEKFMDFGFTKSIVNGGYFPPKDMWYSGFTINYYYFGHLVLATLTRLSGLDLSVTFTLILAALFSLCFTMAGSIGVQLCKDSPCKPARRVLAGLLTGFFVTLAGNMQTIYAFTRGYTGDPPAGGAKPFWELFWKISDAGGIAGFWGKLAEGMNSYWYANATRFIPFTIHEFPSYSFVVSDIHGHVLSIPFALLAIALLIQLFARDSLIKRIGRANTIFLQESLAYMPYIFYGFLAAILFMTNALDGPIYVGIFTVLLIFMRDRGKTRLFTCADRHPWVLHIKQRIYIWVICVISAGITAFPFLLHFKPFVTGIGVNCPPAFLANHKIGPFLFETIDKCQHSPIWMWWLLWGFFVFCGGGWIISKINPSADGQISHILNAWHGEFSQTEKVLLVFFFVSLGLLIFPEFLYFKDIYPAHFRSNTMFKLGYQAFMMLSIVSVYAIAEVVRGWRARVYKAAFIVFLAPQIFLVSIYPLFSVRSYFNGLRSYESLDGMGWMRRQYPDDFLAIEWLNNQKIKQGEVVLVEADGDSYTDYARVSAFTGIPTVIGWPVHEWLWRGSYDVVAPRRSDVARIYETASADEARRLLQKYSVTYVIIGTLERQKYPNLYESKFMSLGVPVFTSAGTTIYKL